MKNSIEKHAPLDVLHEQRNRVDRVFLFWLRHKSKYERKNMPKYLKINLLALQRFELFHC